MLLIGQTNDIETSEKNLGPSHLYLHWMVINIPGSKLDQGQTITSYKGPAPKSGTGAHRYVIVAYEQKSDTPLRIDHGEAPFRTSFPCQVNMNHIINFLREVGVIILCRLAIIGRNILFIVFFIPLISIYFIKLVQSPPTSVQCSSWKSMAKTTSSSNWFTSKK